MSSRDATRTSPRTVDFPRRGGYRGRGDARTMGRPQDLPPANSYVSPERLRDDEQGDARAS